MPTDAVNTTDSVDSTGSTEQVTRVIGDEIHFAYPDPELRYTAVQLKQPVRPPADATPYERTPPGWRLVLPRPSVQRLEYQVETQRPDADWELGLDPTNPHTVEAPFGPKSWLPMPGYREPAWLSGPAVEGDLAPLSVGDIDLAVWSPADTAADDALPLLLSHDGPEFAEYAALIRYSASMIADGTLPPHRLALLSPGGDRNRRYGANPDYTAAVTGDVLDTVDATYARTGGRVLMGASLGALAALFAEWSEPGSFAGLFLQSGSFFTGRTDPQERSFSRFAPVSGFVQRVLAATDACSTPVVSMTSGATEENVHNNRVMAAHLTDLGWPVEFAEVPDLHNFTCWRDAFDPHLTRLLARVWRADDEEVDTGGA